MRDITDYQEKYIENYGFEHIQVMYRRKTVMELLQKYKHNSILEIGCGLEPLYKYFDDYDRLVIVEPAEAFFHELTDSTRVTCIKGFFEEMTNQVLDLEIDFDYIILGSLLHEVEEPQRLLRAVFECCTENTVVHINVPNANSMHRLLAEKMGIIKNVYEISKRQTMMQRNRVYDMDSLRREVEAAGGRILESGGCAFVKLFTHQQMEKMIKEDILDMQMMNGLYELGKDFPDNCSEIYVQAARRDKISR